MTYRAAQIGTNLLNYRGDMSQTELAGIMRGLGFKWSQATVWAIEKGERSLRLEEAEAVARCLGIAVQDLLREDDDLEVWARRQSVIAAKDRMTASARSIVEDQIDLVVELDGRTIGPTSKATLDDILSLDPVQIVAETVAEIGRDWLKGVVVDAGGVLSAPGTSVAVPQALLKVIAAAQDVESNRGKH